MKRPATLAAIVAAVAAVTFLALDQDIRARLRGGPAGGADSVWYHASDVSELARSGRPQLVEFFHPD